MANWSDLKNAVKSVIKTNGNQEITGKVLQDVLNNIISNIGLNSTFAGIATPETNPGTPDGNVFYLATTAGTYSNFNGIIIEAGEAVILEWKGSWMKKTSGFATKEELSELGSKDVILSKQLSIVKGGDISVQDSKLDITINNGDTLLIYVKDENSILNKEKTYLVRTYDELNNEVENLGSYPISEFNTINISKAAKYITLYCWYCGLNDGEVDLIVAKGLGKEITKNETNNKKDIESLNKSISNKMFGIVNNESINSLVKEIVADVDYKEVKEIRIFVGNQVGDVFYNGLYLMDANGKSLCYFEASYQSKDESLSAWNGVITNVDGTLKFLAIPTQIVKYAIVKDVVVNYPLTLSYSPNINGLSSSDNPLNGKIVAFDGDSICYGAGSTGGYGKIIAERNNMTYQNLGIGGGTIASGTYSGESQRHWICQSVERLREDADYIILEGGVNDASLGVTLGSLSDGYSRTLNEENFYGAFESMLRKTLVRFKGKKIGYIFVHQMTENFRITNEKEGSYYWAARQCCEKWGIPFCDLNASCPAFGLFNNDNQALMGLRTKYTYNGDGWHPNEEGYKKYYCDKIEAWMKTL